MADKSISQFQEYSDKIEGDELLIISKTNNLGQYTTRNFKVQYLERDISNDTAELISSEVSSYVYSISSDVSSIIDELSIKVDNSISSISSNVSSIIDELSIKVDNSIGSLSSCTSSVISSISSGVSSVISSISSSVSSNVEKILVPVKELKSIMGLSTLDYYTFIGDKVEFDTWLEEQKRIHSNLSDEQKVLWFDTTNDERYHSLETIQRLDNLQVQIYRLGLQIRDFHKVLENGVIPGDAYSDTKDEMITFGDEVQPPDEILLDGQELISMSIYGNYYCKNKQLYYLMFNPTGYIPNDHKFDWIIKDHDENTLNIKTITFISSDNQIYSLKAELSSINLSSYTQISLSASIYENEELPVYTTNQNTINEVISALSVNSLNSMSFYVSSDYYDEQFKEYVQSEDFELSFKPEKTSYEVPQFSITGEDYVDTQGLYYCLLDESTKKFPLNINTNWFFLSTFYITEGGIEELSSIKTDKFIRSFQIGDETLPRIGQVTYQLLHYLGTPICQVSVGLSNCTEVEAKDISSTIYVESNYDNSISASKNILGIGGIKPVGQLVEPTVKSVCAKYDYKANLVEKQATLYQGEIVYFLDTNQLAVWNGSAFKVLNSSESAGLSKEEIQDIGLDYLAFSPNSSSSIINKVRTSSDGKFHIIQKNTLDSASDYGFDSHDSGNVWVSHLLQIGKIYCGGTELNSIKKVADNSLSVTSLVSHNFIELVNASDEDINLDKIYLMYHTTDSDFSTIKTESANSEWEFLKLEGIIKAHGTYLIRGAMCNPCKNVLINIDSCDIEWRKRTKDDIDIMSGSYTKFTRSGNLIQFSQNKGSFFLCYATFNSDGTTHGDNIKNVISGILQPRDMNVSDDRTHGGYVDLIGLGDCSYYEGDNGSYKSPKNNFNNLIIYKWFYMDPSKQGNKAYSSRSNKTLLTNVNLENQPYCFKGNKSTTKRDYYYYDDITKQRFKPGSSEENHDIFSIRTLFKKNIPNMPIITFGIQATYNQDKEIKASRCFNWVSVGYFNEFVEIRKIIDKSTKQYSEWEKYYSITEQDDDSFIIGNNYNYHKFYDRQRWTSSDGTFVTTHKVIVKNKFTDGIYQYRIGRDNDNTYYSEVFEFTVLKDSDVESFSFIQTSDQQGFNFIEYQAWKAACKAISMYEPSFNFTINTGDIAQSGNRCNEWLDYYDGRQFISEKEEMFTIGNNDLCGSPEHILGDGNDNTSKFNLINILHYYTFELDTENLCFSTYNGIQYPLYSLYSFDYGKWHFISLVSEIRSEYGKAYGLDEAQWTSFSKKLNSDVEKWFKIDLMKYMLKNNLNDCSKCIVFMHEMPFTMVTPDFFDINNSKTGRSTKKTGCKLNLENENGSYRFSRIFRKAGIRLVIGGHKHTFTLSNPIYDAPLVNVLPINNDNISSTLSDDIDPFIYDPIDDNISELSTLSHKPYIEMPMLGVKNYINNKIENYIKDEYPDLYQQFNTLNQNLIEAYNNENETQFTQIVNNITELARNNEISIFSQIDLKTSSLENFLRIRFIKKIQAPTLVMSQATGYKVVSNKELPAAIKSTDGICRYTPWLLSYCASLESSKGDDGSWSSTKNPVQLRPTYIKYDLDNSNISVQIKQIDGIYTIDQNGKQTSFNLDNQKTILSCFPLTFGKYGTEKNIPHSSPTTLSDYMEIYNDYILDDTYVIKL